MSAITEGKYDSGSNQMAEFAENLAEWAEPLFVCSVMGGKDT